MKFKPFKAVLPAADKVHLVASRSYVSYSKEDLVEKLQGNPYTFLHIIHPDVDGDYRGRRIAYFEEVRKNYEKLLEENPDHTDSIGIRKKISALTPKPVIQKASNERTGK